MVAAAVAIISLGAIGFFYYKNNLSQEAKIYAEEIKMLKSYQGRLAPAEEKIKTNAIRVPILVYHGVGPFYLGASQHLKTFGVEPETFERQLQYLKTNSFTSVSFEQLTNSLSNKLRLPEKPVILTFDDGWKNQYIHAFPLLKKYNFTATFFIPTDSIGKRSLLNWDEIKEMDRAGMVIGSHTKKHLFLDDVGDEELKEELVESKKILESQLEHLVLDIAYPYGRYNEKVLKAVKDAGYRDARTTDPGVYQPKTDIFKLKGILIFNNLEGFVGALGK